MAEETTPQKEKCQPRDDQSRRLAGQCRLWLSEYVFKPDRQHQVRLLLGVI